ncbi:MAG: porphobilinogen synthase [Candidatus Omnitrophica bacterium]|nr:porphobilinogen synthase [Candidatus Omnitrophota bacterium]
MENNIIYPYFVVEGRNKKQEIKNFPGIYRFSADTLLKDVSEAGSLGLSKILLFGIPSRKDSEAVSACGPGSIAAKAVKSLKKEFKDLTVFTDVCLCAYTTHGHCGLFKEGKREIDPKRTLSRLADVALSHAEAGVDFVAPSAMAKGQILAIRNALDKRGFRNVKIMGYSAKFASNFYGPFREAADSAPAFGDRSGYQLNYTDPAAALREITQDIKEGADIVMVKPALSYLDVIKQASLKFDHPLAAFNVSGEYALVKYGAGRGLWDEKKMTLEIISSIKRAGADLIITYHAKDIAKWLKKT